jgi:hypothetical protein
LAINYLIEGIMNPEKILEDKPLAYYQFNEVSGATTIVDYSGNGNQGSLSPTGITLGIADTEGNTAALFNNDRVLILNTSALNPANITLETLIIWSGENGVQ